MGATPSVVAGGSSTGGRSRSIRHQLSPKRRAPSVTPSETDALAALCLDEEAVLVSHTAWRDSDDERQLTARLLAPASPARLSALHMKQLHLTITSPTGMQAPAMPHFEPISPHAARHPAQREGTAVKAEAAAAADNPLNKAMFSLTSMDGSLQGGMSVSKTFSSTTMQDVTFGASATVATRIVAPPNLAAGATVHESARRHPVVSFGDAAGPQRATVQQVTIVDTAEAAAPEAMRGRRVAYKLSGYPGYAQSMKMFEAAAGMKRDQAVKQEKLARLSRKRQENEASASELGSLAGESRAFTTRVSKQMTESMRDLRSYTANMEVVMRTWECVSEQYDGFVCELGEVMSAEHPEYAKLFLTSSLSAQARVMVDMIGEALVIIARPNEMFEKLLEMGALHRRYNVGEEHFVALKEVFLAVLPKYLPPDMRDSCEAAWEPFWNIVIPLLMYGRSSARGDWHALQHKEAFLAEARRIMGEIMARKTSSERGTFMLEMLEGAVELDPTMERFALLRDRRTAIRAFTGMAHLLKGTTDLAATQLLMEDLAFRHSVFGLDAAAMRGFRQPFIETCHYSMWKKKCLELWQPDTPRSLGEFWDYVTASWDTAMQSNTKARMAQAERAPDGNEPFCLMFTDIEGSTRLWERNAAAMADAVEAHHRVIRGAIADYGAYEVKTVGDSFVIAAKSVLIAVRIALAIQLELMRGPIANGFEMVSDPQGSGPAHCWRSDSLRVRVGIHYCRDASAVYDSVQRRYDYYGPSVNCTARVESAACGGQILISEEALDVLQDMPEYNTAVTGAAAALKADLASRAAERRGSTGSLNDAQDHLNGSRPLSEMVVLRNWGEHIFKGIAKDVQVYSMLPKALAERSFPLPEKSLGSSMASSRSESLPVSQVGSIVTQVKRFRAVFTPENEDRDFDTVMRF